MTGVLPAAEEVRVTRWCGAARGLAPGQVLEAVLGSCGVEPVVAWIEPVPTRARLENFTGLWLGSPEQVAGQLVSSLAGGFSIAEARIGAGAGGFHLVCEADRVRWSLLMQGDDPSGEGPEAIGRLGSGQSEVSREEFDCRRVAWSAQLMTDWQRYGLAESLTGDWPEQIGIEEFWRGGTLAAWRLTADQTG
jgi:hypothetical protein